MAFAIKAKVSDPRATIFRFHRPKDDVRRQAYHRRWSEYSCSQARTRAARASSHSALSPPPNQSRSSRNCSTNAAGDLVIRSVALAKRPLGRCELKPLTDWNHGQPGTELNFKLYRRRQQDRGHLGGSGERSSVISLRIEQFAFDIVPVFAAMKAAGLSDRFFVADREAPILDFFSACKRRRPGRDRERPPHQRNGNSKG